jgi:hypothetical protein
MATSQHHDPAPTHPAPTHEPARWRCAWHLEKYRHDPATGLRAPDPYETIDGEGNMLVTGGVSALWNRLITADASIAGAVDPFDANAAIGVGTGTTAEAASQTALQGGSTHYEVLDAAPTHTDSTTTVGAQTCTFIATFETGDANFAWNEWGVFNAVTPGRMLNRKVVSLGTKTSADSWVFTVTITIS